MDYHAPLIHHQDFEELRLIVHGLSGRLGHELSWPKRPRHVAADGRGVRFSIGKCEKCGLTSTVTHEEGDVPTAYGLTIDEMFACQHSDVVRRFRYMVAADDIAMTDRRHTEGPF